MDNTNIFTSKILYFAFFLEVYDVSMNLQIFPHLWWAKSPIETWFFEGTHWFPMWLYQSTLFYILFKNISEWMYPLLHKLTNLICHLNFDKIYSDYGEMGRFQREDTNLWSYRQSWSKWMILKIKPKYWNLQNGPLWW